MIEALNALIQEASQHPILQHEEVVALAQTMETGTEDERAQARRMLIESNIRLVVKVASREHTRSKHDTAEMVQYGLIGLIRAVDTFDWRRGFRLSTYAVRCVLREIRRNKLRSCEVIELPEYVRFRIWAIHDAGNRLTDPTVEELAEDTGLTIDQVLSTQAVATIQPLSLDAAMVDAEVEDLTSASTVEDLSIPDTDAQLDRIDARDTLRESMASLPERKRRVLEMRYGLGGYPPMTRDEIGRELGISQDMVRRMNDSAMTKLRTVLASQLAGSTAGARE